jgi:hypothetical protein
MASSTASRKAKGRRLQQYVRDEFRQILAPYGIHEEDCQSTSMGVSGIDVTFSAAVKAIINPLIECKAKESCNVVSDFQHHLETYSNVEGLKMLVHSKNHTRPMVTLNWSDFRVLLESHLSLNGRKT